MTDLGTLGLTGSGFEVAAPDVAGLQRLRRHDRRRDRGVDRRSGRAGGARDEPQLRRQRPLPHRAAPAREFTVFVNNIDDNIQKQALILPQGAVGTVLGGQPITAQNANGAVFVAASTTPVLVRANFDNARIWGIEYRATSADRTTLSCGRRSPTATSRTRTPTCRRTSRAARRRRAARLVRVRAGRRQVVGGAVPACRRRAVEPVDARPRRSPHRRRRARAATSRTSSATARATAAGSRPAPTASSATRRHPDRDRRNARADAGPRARRRRQLRRAVLRRAELRDVRRPLRRAVRPHPILIDAENLNDENYRGISWGMDAPGRGISGRYVVRF